MSVLLNRTRLPGYILGGFPFAANYRFRSPNANVISKGEIMTQSPWSYRILLLVLIAMFCVSILAVAQDSKPAQQPTTFNLANQKYLFGDWGGARTRLEEQKGVKFDFFYVADLLANPKGAPRRKAAGSVSAAPWILTSTS